MTSNTARIRNSAKALIVRDGAILLQRCRIGGQLVHLLPGGTQEHGEPLIDTVRREVHEETGLRVRVERLLWVREFIAAHYIPGTNDEHRVECIFHCIPEDGATIGSALVPDAAQLDVRWVALTALPTLTMWPETVKRLLTPDFDPASAPIPVYLGDCP
jgi:8-oxo-dGTP diphosphatase